MIKYGYGADIGGTSVKLGLITTDGELIEKWEIRTDTSDNGAHIIPNVARSINDNIAAHGLNKDDIVGIGVGVPGPAHKDGTASAVNLGWYKAPVVEPLQELTGLSVKTANDACAAALGEMWMGSGKGYTSLLLVTLGTGVGGGIIIDGKILEGANSCAGELGHIPLEPDYPVQCNCGGYGCFELFASANGNVRVANDYLKTNTEPTSLSTVERINSKTLWDHAIAGDKVAIAIAEKFSDYLGRGIASVVNTIDPEIILLGGGVSRTGQPLVDYVTRYYKKYVFHGCRETPIRIATLGNDAGIFGCVCMLIQ